MLFIFYKLVSASQTLNLIVLLFFFGSLFGTRYAPFTNFQMEMDEQNVMLLNLILIIGFFILQRQLDLTYFNMHGQD